jgi:hypothetical protein
MCYHHRRECIAVTQSGRADFQAASNSQDQRTRPLFFRERNAARLKDFCGADEIDG